MNSLLKMCSFCAISLVGIGVVSARAADNEKCRSVGERRIVYEVVSPRPEITLVEPVVRERSVCVAQYNTTTVYQTTVYQVVVAVPPPTPQPRTSHVEYAYVSY